MKEFNPWLPLMKCKHCKKNIALRDEEYLLKLKVKPEDEFKRFENELSHNKKRLKELKPAFGQFEIPRIKNKIKEVKAALDNYKEYSKLSSLIVFSFRSVPCKICPYCLTYL